ncbi:MAG: 50S ribosomal protein L10 [Candidatus Limnocylindria bacterium]
MAKVKTGPKVRRRGGGVAAKAAAVGRLAERISASTAVIVTDYRGLTVRDLQELRRRLRPKGLEYHVVKNSLFGRAAEQAGRGALGTLLSGPTAVALGAVDEVELAKGVVDELRTLRTLKIVGALVSGRALGPEEVTTLAQLPPRPQLEATIVGSLQAPFAGVAGVLQAPLSGLIHVLAARGAA